MSKRLFGHLQHAVVMDAAVMSVMSQHPSSVSCPHSRMQSALMFVTLLLLCNLGLSCATCFCWHVCHAERVSLSRGRLLVVKMGWWWREVFRGRILCQLAHRAHHLSTHTHLCQNQTSPYSRLLDKHHFLPLFHMLTPLGQSADAECCGGVGPGTSRVRAHQQRRFSCAWRLHHPEPARANTGMCTMMCTLGDMACLHLVACGGSVVQCPCFLMAMHWWCMCSLSATASG